MAVAPEGDTSTISRTSSKNLIWSFPQMIAHHTLGGCPLRPGDLLGSGTISGTGAGEKGSMLEMNDGGKKEILLAGMDSRVYLKDGDTITMRGAAGPSGERVGFGECVGRIFGPQEHV
jgi:fumarylacetoacetase